MTRADGRSHRLRPHECAAGPPPGISRFRIDRSEAANGRGPPPLHVLSSSKPGYSASYTEYVRDVTTTSSPSARSRPPVVQ